MTKLCISGNRALYSYISLIFSEFKKWKKPTLKKFLIFQETELSHISPFGRFHFSPFSGVFIFHLSQVFQFFTFLGCFHFHISQVFHFSPFLGVFVLLYREWYGFERAFFTHKRFLPYTPSRHLAQPAFIKASMRAGSSSLKVAGPLT